MRLFRLFVAALLLSGIGLSSVPAHAGSLMMAQPIWENRVTGRLRNQLNRKDCLDNAQASFSLSMLGFSSSYQLQIWSGANCDKLENRSASSATKTCTQVLASASAVNQTVKVWFRDMVAPYGSTPSDADTICDMDQTSGLQTRTLYFVVVDPSNLSAVAGGVASWPFTYDIKAPPPPSGVTADSGDESLVTRFTVPSGETNLLHYHFYCDHKSNSPVITGGGAAGTGGTAGAATSTDLGGTAGMSGTAGTDTGGTAGTDATGGTAGTDTGGTSTSTGGTSTGGTSTAGASGSAGTAGFTQDPNCTSTLLVPGSPPPDDAIDCGTIGAQGTSGGETKPVLDNGFPYVVAVATEDTVNNIGVLSNLACNTPKDVVGFYEAYNKAGGHAGGGYCTFAPAKRGDVAALIAFALGACALVRRRR